MQPSSLRRRAKARGPVGGGRAASGERWDDLTVRRSRGDHVLAAIPLAWLAVLFLLPLGFTLVYSFGTSGFGTVRLGFSFDNYVQALGPLYLETFLRTLGFGMLGLGWGLWGYVVWLRSRWAKAHPFTGPRD